MPEFPTSAKQLKENLADRIKLGLDLKGGSHLVLQVQVDEAIGQRCDETMDSLYEAASRKERGVRRDSPRGRYAHSGAQR